MNAIVDRSAPAGATRYVMATSWTAEQAGALAKTVASVRQEVPRAQSDYYLCCAQAPAAQRHRKTGPLRARFKFVGAGADYHLPEGNSCRRFGRNLGGWTTDRRQQRSQYAERHESEQPGGPHASHAGVASSGVLNRFTRNFSAPARQACSACVARN